MIFARETIIILWNVIILIWKFENKHRDIIRIMERAHSTEERLKPRRVNAIPWSSHNQFY
jgi:hypothetical protein